MIAWLDHGSIEFDAARLSSREGDVARVASLTARSYPDRVPAAFFRHNSIIPELEEREGEVLGGTLCGDSLEVEKADAWGNTQRRRTLKERWRSRQDLERGCRKGLNEFAD